MSRFLIEKDGEKQFVGSLDGYDGWTVLGRGKCAAPPIGTAQWIHGRWVADRDPAVASIKAEAERRILAKWPVYKQLNATHEPDADWVKQMRKEIKAIRDWSNREEGKLK
jgi:hypothetical protein